MNPAKVVRSQVKRFTDLPNVGPSVAGDLRLLGFSEPSELAGQDPVALYHRLCALTQCRQDPCVLDVFMSITRFMDGEAPRPWWDYTEARKRLLGSPRLTLPRVLEVLRLHQGPEPGLPGLSPFEWVLLENVAYLAPPDRKRRAFEVLKRTLGTRPESILGAKSQALEAVTAHGILKGTFADKLRECARLALDRGGRLLREAEEGPAAVAKRALRAFPGIGEPGAERILLFTGRFPFLAPESHGLRVLVRLGLVPQLKGYAQTYAAARSVAEQLPAEIPLLQEAHLRLQRHGRELCRSGVPKCPICPLRGVCAYAANPTPGPDLPRSP